MSKIIVIVLFLIVTVPLCDGCSVTCGVGTEQVCEKHCKPFRGCVTYCNNVECYRPPCPIDCVLSVFGEWGPCSYSCGLGSQVRTRGVIVWPNYGGRNCDHTSEIQYCNPQPCPIDCVMSDWSSWSPCSNTCEEGIIMRSRTIIVASKHEGIPCGPTSEIQTCNSFLSIFNEWTVCTKTCGTGYQHRYNIVERSQNCSREQTRTCNTQPCSENCLLSSFGDWTECSKTCGGGQRERVRDVIVSPTYGGTPCDATRETELCNTCSCPQNCVMANYGQWSTCSKPCGTGVKTRTRSVKQEGANGGEVCGTTIEYQLCNTEPCDVDCVMSDWIWTDCDKTCGGGKSYRIRTILIMSQFNGKPCEATREEFECNVCPCPVDCEMTNWSEWTDCSVTCGTGSAHQYREIVNEEKHGGKKCGSTTNIAICKLQPCPVDCEVGIWGVYSTCSLTCGGGTRKKSRPVVIPSINGGTDCEETEVEEMCNTEPCPQDCVMANWESWSACDRTCGGGTTSRTRCSIIPALHGGRECGHTLETQPCNTQPCPKDCLLSKWSNWSPCTTTCGGGTTTRTRIVIRPAEFGGICLPLKETEVCNSNPCPVDCVLGNWSDWSKCDKTCGGGTSKRVRDIIISPNSFGKQCDVVQETKNCNTNPCPIDCAMSTWSDWSQCSTTCGGGERSRSRTVETNENYGGKNCDEFNSEDIEECNTNPCPVDCVTCNWSKWSSCDKTCGMGSQTRTRCIHVFPSNGGKDCPDTQETQSCNTNNCPVDCVFNKWSNWTSCDKSCAGGIRIRTRNKTEEKYGGKPCIGNTTETFLCNTSPCPVDCVLSSWSNYSACDKTCGKGKLVRTRNVITSSTNGGRPCGITYDSIPCNTEPCNIIPTT